ncbi:hypothetical protein CHS0354_007791 [Potamilus streckersoni]|uniref:Uncharacterized protein n=1 Tax=Potamilus streckersoni TaxID=2493646 RepID=A0AAE0TG83_9BIVA|nr:hypothetical protein CHS0354_007791 [Potamilus streckersoni]
MDEAAVHATVKRNFSNGNKTKIMNNVSSNSRIILKGTSSLIQGDANADRKNIFGIRNPAFDQNENPIDSQSQVIIKDENQPELETGPHSVSNLNVLVTEAVVHSALQKEKGPGNKTDLTVDTVSDWPHLDSITLPVDEGHSLTVEKNIDEQNLLKQNLVTNREIQNAISDIKSCESKHLISSKLDYPSSVSVSEEKNNSVLNVNSSVSARGTDIDFNVEVSLNYDERSTEQSLNSSQSSHDRHSEYDKEQLKSHSGNVEQSSSRPIKSILAITNTNAQTGNSKSKSHPNSVSEHKSVKFTEDTVFNEDRPKKYKAEQINLREIYGNRISNDAAFVKINPVYMENVSDLDREKAHSLTDDEKMEFRRSFHRTDRHGADRNGKIIGVEVPRYDRLLQRTIAKKRRQLCIKWMLVIVIVIIITTVATVLGVHFSDPK